MPEINPLLSLLGATPQGESSAQGASSGATGLFGDLLASLQDGSSDIVDTLVPGLVSADGSPDSEGESGLIDLTLANPTTADSATPGLALSSEAGAEVIGHVVSSESVVVPQPIISDEVSEEPIVAADHQLVNLLQANHVEPVQKPEVIVAEDPESADVVVPQAVAVAVSQKTASDAVPQGETVSLDSTPVTSSDTNEPPTVSVTDRGQADESGENSEEIVVEDSISSDQEAGSVALDEGFEIAAADTNEVIDTSKAPVETSTISVESKASADVQPQNAIPLQATAQPQATTNVQSAGDRATYSPVLQQASNAIQETVASFENTESSKVVSVQLHPKELGQLTIRLEQTTDVLTAQIVATDAMSTEILQTQRDQLVESLSELGFDDLELDISHQDRQQAEQQQSDSRGKGKRIAVPFASVAEQADVLPSESIDNSSLNIVV